MKVYFAQRAPLSPRGEEAEGWCSPWTVQAIQDGTRDHLAGLGAVAESLESADIVLVDLVDHFAAASSDFLADLKRKARGAGTQMVVRLHGAWRHGSFDYLDAAGPDLDAVWDTADAVLVGSRSHLVRLASLGGIDAARTRIAPVAFDGRGPAAASSEDGCGRTRLLVAGETHRTAMGPVLEMLAEADPQKATSEVIGGLEQFRDRVAGARAVLVPAVASFGDRALIDAALRAGVTVIASHFAGAIDAPLPQGMVVVAKTKSSAGWRAALERGLSLEPPSGDCNLAQVAARQEEILRSIWADGSHFAGRTAV